MPRRIAFLSAITLACLVGCSSTNLPTLACSCAKDAGGMCKCILKLGICRCAR